MHSPRFRLVVGTLLSLALALLWVGHGPAAGEPKKGEPKEEKKKDEPKKEEPKKGEPKKEDKKADEPKPTPAEPLPAVFTKDQPESVDDLKAIEAHVGKQLQKITPAVVGVRIGAASGSGVIVTKDGYVLTAGHVSGKPERDAVIIMPNGRQVKAKTLGSNGGIDSGLIKIVGEEEWPFVEMGKSEDLKKGSWVLAIGHPGGFRPNRTPVVRLGRVLLNNEFLVRSDCTIVGGDSGGPLFDMHGKVVGIHSRIGGSITENIHVPVAAFREKKNWDKLVKGEVWGGLLGQQAVVQSPGGKVVYEKEGKITAEDPLDKKQMGSHFQLHTFKMTPGSAYTLDMTSPDGKKLDPFLRLEDPAGKQLAEDDDGAGNLNSRIVYRPSTAGEYKIIATTFMAAQTGPYKLIIRQYEIKPIVAAGKVDVLPALLRAPRTAATQIIEKVLQAGVPLFASGFLLDENGQPVTGRPVQFRWEKGQTQVKTDDKGSLRLQLSKQNSRGLMLEVPEGLKFALELTDGAGNPVPLGASPAVDKETIKSAGGKLVLEEKGVLSDKDGTDKIRPDLLKRKITKSCYHKVYTFKMAGGSTYTLDLQSGDFDAYLRLEDPSGKQLAEDDDGAGKYNSRIVFTPETDGEYRLIVTTCDPDQYGSYRLAVTLAEAKKNDKGD